MASNKPTLNADAIDKFVAEQIKTLRIALGITQEEIAKEVGVTFQQIQKYERGLNRITVGKLYMIALAFDVAIQSFFPQRQFGEYSPLPPRMLRMMKLVAALSEKHRDEIHDILKAVDRIAGDSQAGE